MSLQPSASSSSSGFIPFPLQTGGQIQSNMALDSFLTQHDDPPNAYTFGQPMYPSTSQRQPELEQVQEWGFGEAPGSFLARMQTIQFDNANSDALRSPVQQRFTSSRRSTLSIPTPATPSTSTLTTGTTASECMSRQSSTCNDAFSHPMMLNNSNTSFLSDSSELSQDLYSYYSKETDQNQLVNGAGAGIYCQDSLPFLQSDGLSNPFPSVIQPEDMQRTESTQSNRSSTSTSSSSSSSSSSSRSRDALQKQNQLAARKLAPKAGSEEDLTSHRSSAKVVPIKSKDGMDDKSVAPIPKTPYQRPKHDKVICTLCNDYPEGFRGAHELGRHQDRQHKVMVKKFMCIEPRDGIKSQFKPVTSLSKCKACNQQKKMYGAYYNAAAHLRRAHFVPKSRGRGKSAKTDERSEKRGGKGGGDWPPMAELKRWMTEVDVKADATTQAEDEESENEDIGNDYNEDLSNLTSNNSNVGAMNIDKSLLYSQDTTMYDAYTSSAASSYGVQNMNMQFNLPFDSVQQNDVNVAMLYPSGQTSPSFDSSSALMSDNMYFDTVSHQPFATTSTHYHQVSQNFEDVGSESLFYYERL
jgi:hypothetical protein